LLTGASGHGEHSANELSAAAYKADIEGVTRDSVGVVGDLGQRIERRVARPLMLPPEQRQNHIGDEQVGGEDDDHGGKVAQSPPPEAGIL
jgi:hypothetical protein